MNADKTPVDQLNLVPGMKISSSGLIVGKLDDLIRDSQNGQIMFLLMQEGHLWGKKDVAIPITDVDYTDGDTIYLSIAKEAVEALPAVPVDRSK